MKERTKLLLIVLVFFACYYIPWAFFIAGAISVFVSQASVLKYFGATARKILSYSVASVSGTILAVCSCTVLPLFAGIYTRGAGIGPATAFLYSGPAINVLAIVLTARVLGWQLGLARAIGAILFAVITGLLMAFIFRKEDAERSAGQIYLPDEGEKGRTLVQDSLFMLTMVLILIFAAFAHPAPGATGLWPAIYAAKWYITAALLIILAFMLKAWFVKDERVMWVQSTWGFMKQIFPLLGAGVLVAGFMLGLGQFVRIGIRRIDVFCYPYRSSHPPGPPWCRYGPGPRALLAACRPSPFPAQYAGDRGRDGSQEDGHLLRNYSSALHHCWNAIWVDGDIKRRIR